MYSNKYLGKIVIDEIDLLIITLMISFSLTKLIKNRCNDKKKVLDYKLVEDLKRQFKIIERKRKTKTTIKRIQGYSELKTGKKTLEITNKIRGGEIETIVGLLAKDEDKKRLGYYMWYIANVLKNSPRKKY